MSEHVFKTYRSYSFTDKDPIIDRLRTAVQDSGLSYAKVSAESDVSVNCLREWFEGKTRRPQFATVAAVFSALGMDLLPTARGSSKVVRLRAKSENGRKRA